ncbi:hypothetical protein MMC21_001736 [Puttea exsequens]|nr:hypothetical protein [Puttea exsequens]
MLNNLQGYCNGVIYRHLFLRRQPSTIKSAAAFISTNTAINKSLRKSQYNATRPIGRSSSDGEYGDQRFKNDKESTDRPKNIFRRDKQGYRTDNIQQPLRRYQALNAPRRTGRSPSGGRYVEKRSGSKEGSMGRSRSTYPRHERGTDRTEWSRRTQERDQNLKQRDLFRDGSSKYDYSRKPEGNRAARRATMFGYDKEQLRSSRDQRSRALEDNQSQVTVSDQMNRASERHAPRFNIDKMRKACLMPDAARDSSYDPVYQRYGRESRLSFGRPDRELKSDAPISMPYTTSASEFLYGTSTVTAALLAGRRKLYKLYIYDGDKREAQEQDNRIRRLAFQRDLIVQRVKGDWLRVMDKMSMGRPHNGYILEASPLPKLPVTGLMPVKAWQAPLHTSLDYQSREDEEINGNHNNVQYEVGFPRYPIVVLLDGILDPGNLGAILRSAFFLGIDAVAISNRNSAPLSTVALKASSGAAESLVLFSVNHPSLFIDNCQANGWKVYAAAAPGPRKRPEPGRYLSTSEVGYPTRQHPCLLVLGGEGEGLRKDIQRKADFIVGIDGQRNGMAGVDSLNVSVAAGLLCDTFMRKPPGMLNIIGSDSAANVEAGNRLF